MNPIVHTESSMKKFKGASGEDFDQFLKIHEKMDCSKAWISDNRHRTLTHTMFWIKEVMIPIFGSYIMISGGIKVSVKDICEQHILEDYRMKFIPTPQDFIQEMDFKKWMQNGDGVCPSAVKLYPELKPEPQIVFHSSGTDMILDGNQRDSSGGERLKNKLHKLID